MILLTPTAGALRIRVEDDEHIKPMTSHQMMILIERLTIACRLTLMAEADRPAPPWCDEATRVLK
jgi:hypothetical protein